VHLPFFINKFRRLPIFPRYDLKEGEKIWRHLAPR
jgi:hypothetical protein